MPHLVILYTSNLEGETDMNALCQTLAGTMRAIRDEAGKPVFPVGGIRVMAYVAAHHAVADGGAAGREAGTHRGADGRGDGGDYAFVYLNLRMNRGRTSAVQQATGKALLATARAHLAPLFEQRRLGLTLQVDEGTEVFDGKQSNLHPMFAQRPP